RNSLLVCRSPALDRRPLLFGWQAHSFAVSVAPATRCGSRPPRRDLVAAFRKSRRGKPFRHCHFRRSVGGILERLVLPARAESEFRWKKPSLASVARVADRSLIRGFVGGRWGALNWGFS